MSRFDEQLFYENRQKILVVWVQLCAAWWEHYSSIYIKVAHEARQFKQSVIKRCRQHLDWRPVVCWADEHTRTGTNKQTNSLLYFISATCAVLFCCVLTVALNINSSLLLLCCKAIILPEGRFMKCCLLLNINKLERGVF